MRRDTTFGGMGHTAGMHTQDRDAAIRYGAQMPAARVIINSPTTHGAIGFSTDSAAVDDVRVRFVGRKCYFG